MPRGYDPYNDPYSDRIGELIRARGDIAARQSLESGDIWGRGIQNIAGQLGAGVQQYAETRAKEQEEKKETARGRAWNEVIQSGEWQTDPGTAFKKAVQIWGHQRAGEQMKGLEAAHKMTMEGKTTPEQDQKRAGTIATALDDWTDAEIAEKWPEVSGIVGNVFGVQLEKQWDPSMRQKYLKPIKKAYGPKEEKVETEKIEVRNPDGSTSIRIVPKVAGQVFESAAAVPTAPGVGTFEDYVTQKYGERPTPQQITQARKEYSQADNLGTGTGLSPGMESNILNRLTTQWDKASAPVRELDRQARLMNTGLEAARKGDLAAGSQAVLVTFQKILDPTSVVRESEYARSAAGQSLLARIQGAAEKLAKGGAGVPVSELEKFKNLADQMVKNAGGDYLKAVKERLGRTADRYQIPRDIVFEDLSFGPSGEAPATPAPISVTAPNGKVYSFPNQEQANAFKQKAGIR